MPTFTRSELYDLVWTEPRSRLAKKLGVSDVWISKTCRQANIPVPPPGYWARKDAGKASAPPALPHRGLGQADNVEVGGGRYARYQADESDEIPPIPVFVESVDTVYIRARLALGKIAVPRNLDHLAPAITKLLDEDEELRKALARNSYSWRKPRFDAPSAQRRIKILNALLVMAEKTGCSGTIRRDDLVTTITVGDTGVSVTLAAKGAKAKNHFDNPLGLADETREKLTLELSSWPNVPDLPHQWMDSDDNRLEQQLPEVAVAVLVLGEMAYRSRQFQHRDWVIEQKERREAEARQRKLEAERKEAERLARIEKARVDHLLLLADQLRKSEDIRALVLAVTSAGGPGPALDAWRSRALAVADRIDPRQMPLDDVLGP